jgi:hypothetical protein
MIVRGSLCKSSVDSAIKTFYSFPRGPVSVVGIATLNGLDGPGIESQWRRDFPTCLDRPWFPPNLLYNGYRAFPGGKERPGRELTPHPLLVPWSWKSSAIPLRPLWAVRPVQSLSACTRVHFTFFTLFIPTDIVFRPCLWELRFSLVVSLKLKLPYLIYNVVIHVNISRTAKCSILTAHHWPTLRAEQHKLKS